MKINISQIAEGFSLSKINDAFQKIVAELNGKVLYRDNPTGEPNEMNNALDMNGNRVYNLPEPTADHEAATLKTVKDQSVGGQYKNTLRTPDSVNSLPNAAGRADRVLAFDSTGQPVCVFSPITPIVHEDIVFISPLIGVVLKSPNGNLYRLKVDNEGTISTQLI